MQVVASFCVLPDHALMFTFPHEAAVFRDLYEAKVGGVVKIEPIGNQYALRWYPRLENGDCVQQKHWIMSLEFKM